MKKPPLPSPTYENNLSRMATLAGRAGLVAILLPMLMLVLLPLLWMILTAFKVPGTAFKLQFLPQTHVYTPNEEFAALPVANLSADQGWLHLEYTDDRATTVEAIITDADGTATERSLSRLGTDLWAVDYGPLKPGAYSYQFSVGGNEPIADPKLEADDATGQNRSTLEVVAGNIAYAPEPRSMATLQNGKISISYTGEPGKQVGLQLFALEKSTTPEQRDRYIPIGKHQLLAESTSGMFKDEVVSPANPEVFFRLVETLTLSEATSRIYTLENFKAILTNPSFNFASYFFNSLVVAAGTGLLTVLICTLAGYAFVRIPFHGRDKLFFALLSSMLVPGMIYMVPQFSITLGLGLMDTYGGMIIPHLANVFGLFLMKQYIEQIPSDVFSAAEIDGAKDYQIFIHVVIPMCLPIIVTLFLLTFVGQWSNFLWQLIINTGDSQVLTLPVGLQQFKGQNADEWEKIMAGACFSLVPIAILFMFLQRYFLDAVAAGSVKE